MQKPVHALSNTYYGRMKPIGSSLLNHYQGNSGHLMELEIVGNMILGPYWTTPAAEPSQPRPGQR
jgi:hypothetical protein